MKNKGFTLIEMLAVIVILGIVVSITTVSIIAIKEKQDEKNLENVISLILTGAKEYNAENRIDDITVESLLNNGYVDFDTTKYSELAESGLKVERIACPTELSPDKLKREYSITIDGDKYSDCGCSLQGEKETKTICIEE